MRRRTQQIAEDRSGGEPPAFATTKPKPPEHPCAHVSPREASYLLSLHELQRAGTPVTQSALARAVQVTPPAALEMVRRLRTLGLIEPDRLALSTEGTSAALLLASRRHAALVLTQDVLGLDDDAAHPEAAKLAPNLSATLARRLLAGRSGRT